MRKSLFLNVHENDLKGSSISFIYIIRSFVISYTMVEKHILGHFVDLYMYILNF